jgi:hypothetical protein
VQGVRTANPSAEMWVENLESARAITGDSHDNAPNCSSLHS